MITVVKFKVPLKDTFKYAPYFILFRSADNVRDLTASTDGSKVCFDSDLPVSVDAMWECGNEQDAEEWVDYLRSHCEFGRSHRES